MFRTTLTTLFAAAALTLPAVAQEQDATQSKPFPELKETESTYEEVPVVIGTGSTKAPTEDPAVVVLERRAPGPTKVIAEPIEYPEDAEPEMHEPLEEPVQGTTALRMGGLHLELGLDQGILHADIFSGTPKFFGGVPLSLNNEVLDFGEFGLNLLRDSGVMDLGFGAEGHLALKIPAAKDLGGFEFFGQAVIADGTAIQAGEVVAAIAN